MFPVKSLIQNINWLQMPKFLLSKSYTPTAFYSKKTLEELAGIPPKPKRPLNSFTCYVKDTYPQIKAQNPTMNATEVMKLIAKSWETVDATSKTRYTEKFQKDKEIFTKQYEQYKNSLSVDQLEDLKAARMELKEQKEKKLLRTKIRELGRPKKVPTPFVRYLHEERKRDPQSSKHSYQAYMKQASEKWQKLSDKEKKPYLDQFNKDHAQYKVQLEKWEAKMMKQGNSEIVRRATVATPKEAAAKPKSK